MRPDLSYAREALVTAEYTADPARRYVAAQVAALRVAAVVLALRTAPRHTRRPRNAWTLLARCAPAFAEWASYFELTQARAVQVRATPHPVVGDRVADDHVRDAQLFLADVERWLERSSSQACSA